MLNEYGLKVHTLRFNLRVFASHLEERFSNYNSLIHTSPLFQTNISNWTIDSNAILWTGIGYSFTISTSTKQVKGLELPFAFGRCRCEHTSCGQKISPTSETDNC